MKLRNEHGASIEGVAPGETGEFNENNPAVVAMRKANMLVDPRSPRASSSPAIEAMASELRNRAKRIADLEAENQSLRSQLKDAQAHLEAATAPDVTITPASSDPPAKK
jgi:hypothetical protein